MKNTKLLQDWFDMMMNIDIEPDSIFHSDVVTPGNESVYNEFMSMFIPRDKEVEVH